MRSAAKRQKLAHCNRRVAELKSRIEKSQLSAICEQAELLNTSFEPIFLWAFPSQEIKFWNAGAGELYGFTETQALGHSVDELLKPRYSMGAEQIKEEIQQTYNWSGEVTYTANDGREIVVQSRLMLVQLDQEAVVFEANRDLTEAKRAEMGLHLAAVIGSRSRELAAKAEVGWRELRLILENVAQAIVVLDSKGRFITANPAFAHLHALGSVDEIPASVKEFAEFIEVRDSDGEIVPFSERPVQMALAGHTVRDRELTITNLSTGKQWVGALSAIPIQNELGEVTQVVLTIYDLGERKKTEDALRHANADLEQFAYAAAHDLQEPARTVGLYSQLLSQQFGASLDQEKNDLVNGIVIAARRLQDLIRDLLAYTRAIEYHSGDEIGTDANDAFQEVLDNLTSAIDESQAKIHCGALPCIGVRKAHVIQLLQNILTNALKYAGNPPVVDVSAEQMGSDYLFTIQDNGPGISPEYHQRIFKVFTRLHGKNIPGTGIGLAICERIVSHYGGRIWVQSEPGQGAAFQFILPGLHTGSR